MTQTDTSDGHSDRMMLDFIGAEQSAEEPVTYSARIQKCSLVITEKDPSEPLPLYDCDFDPNPEFISEVRWFEEDKSTSRRSLSNFASPGCSSDQITTSL